MLTRRAVGVQQIVVPVIVAIVVIQTVILKHDPRAGRILGLIVPSFVQLEQPTVFRRVVEDPALRGMERLVAEHIHYADVFVT